jgi:hypothetical protein
VKRVEG